LQATYQSWSCDRYVAGCPSCSSIADGFNGSIAHLENHDVAFTAVSRAPLAKLQAFKQRMDWTFPWASVPNGEFNSDFNIVFTERQLRDGPVNYNYQLMDVRPAVKAGEDGFVGQMAAMTETSVATYLREMPGMSAFVLEDGVVYHTYSTYARGLDGLWGMYQWLVRAPKGRNENGVWWRHHDKYDQR